MLWIRGQLSRAIRLRLFKSNNYLPGLGVAEAFPGQPFHGAGILKGLRLSIQLLGYFDFGSNGAIEFQPFFPHPFVLFDNRGVPDCHQQ